MLDFVFIAFVVLAIVILIVAIAPNRLPAARNRPDVVLTIAGESKSSQKVTTGVYDYTYEDLRALAEEAPSFRRYSGPRLDRVLSNLNITYSSLVFYSAGSKRAQRLVQRSDAEAWIVALDHEGRPLGWENGGPFLLIDRRDVSKRVPRLVKIEAR